MSLFASTRADNAGPHTYAQSSYQYLNRSTRPELRLVREVCDSWYTSYPECGKADVRGRFTDKNDSNHFSAFFELFLHELFSRLGFTVTCHPDTPNEATTHHDFLVTSPTGGTFYLEAKVVEGNPTGKLTSEFNSPDIAEVLNHVRSPNFFIYPRIRHKPVAKPDAKPDAKHIRSVLEEHLQNLDPDTMLTSIRENYDYGGAGHVYRYSRGDWEIDF